MLSSRRAFSLIELIVVIAIIGILSAIAVPLYQRYMMKSKVSVGLTTARSYVNKAMAYYEQHGTFITNLSQIGLTPQSDPLTTAYASQPTSLSQYLTPYLLDVTISGLNPWVGNCVAIDGIYTISNFNQYPILNNQTPYSYIQVSDLYIIKKGESVYNIFCSYNGYNGFGYYTDSVVDGCYNLQNTNDLLIYSNLISAQMAACNS